MEKGVIDVYLDGLDRLATVLWNISLGLAALLVFIVTLRVIGRYGLGFVPIWLPEFSRYIAIWFSLLLVGVLVWEDDHLKVTFIYRRLPLKIKLLATYLQLFMVLLFSIVFTYIGFRYTITSGFRGTSSSMGINLYYLYAILPISGALTIVFTIGQIIKVRYNPEIVELEEEEYVEQYKEIPDEELDIDDSNALKEANKKGKLKND